MTVEYLLKREEMCKEGIRILKNRLGGDELRHQTIYQRLREVPRVGLEISSLKTAVKKMDKIVQQSKGFETVLDPTAALMILQEKLPIDIALKIAKVKVEAREREREMEPRKIDETFV